MRRLLFLVIAAMGMFKGYSQALVQTYVDRCTGEVHVFSVPMNGQAVVAFYDKSQVFTAQQFTDGTLQAWLEQTYQWWVNLNPCSTNQAATTATQQTASTAATNATSAATNATQATGGATTGTANTNTTNTNTGNGTSNGTSSSGTGSTDTGSTSNNTSSDSSTGSTNSGDSSSSSSSSDSSSSDSSGNGNDSSGDSSGGSEGNSGEESGSSSDGESSEGDSGGDTEEGKGDTEDTSEDSNDSESSEEDSKSESEESEDNESEDEVEEESSKEESSDEEEEEEEKEKTLAPPIISANVVTMSMLDGTLSTAGSFGYSQSSLTGVETYSANGMLWSNMKQFSITLSRSTAYFRYDREVPIMILNPFTGKKEKFGSYNDKGSVDFVFSETFTYMNMFGTHLIMGGFSNVFLGKPNSKWQGFVGGIAVNGMYMLPKLGDPLGSASITAFGSKPIVFKNLERFVFTPMLAYSASPISFAPKTKKILLSEHGTYVIGTSINFTLTQRFNANIGGTLIGSTIPGFPLSYALTIGSRFAF